MSNLRTQIVGFSIGFLLLAVLAIPAIAQIDIGSLSGVVTDPQGGVIQGAQITAVETGTHATHLATTNGDGVYVVLSLPAGTYNLTMSHPGFQTLTSQNISLASGENKKVDAKLLVGRVAAVRRRWQTNDAVQVELPFSFRLEKIDDQHPDIAALMWGPLMMVALDPSFAIGEKSMLASSGLKAAPFSPLTFELSSAPEKVHLKPFYQVQDEEYTTYLQRA